ncbi:MAG: MOSC domain-containing protein [Dehalococcoidia bacterium]
MSDRAAVDALHIAPAHFQEMRPLETVEIITDLGVEGDRYAAKRDANRVKRQVLLMDHESLDDLDLTPGAVRENITTRGLPLYSLGAGQRLQLGPQVVLEVTAPCEPCYRMDEIRPGLREQLKGRRGMLARVLQGGTISVGDAISVLGQAAK